MKNKLRNDYYRPGVHHLCMFCSTPIARLREGNLEPLGNKAHVLLNKRGGGIYTVNCCGDCAKSVDFRDITIRQSIHRVIMECCKTVWPGRKMNLLATPKADMICIELNSSDRPRNIEKFKEFYASKLR